MMDYAMYILAAAGGGFFGAMCRCLVTQLFCFKYRMKPGVVLLIINALGTFILGMVLGDLSHVHDAFELTLLTVGFCGSFTTFSTYARDLVNFSRQRGWNKLTIFLFILFTFMAGVAAYLLGKGAGHLLSEIRA